MGVTHLTALQSALEKDGVIVAMTKLNFYRIQAIINTLKNAMSLELKRI